MTHFRRPGWAQPNGHIVRSQMEASLCDYLSAAVEPHMHGASTNLSFNVTIAARRHALFIPSIILTETKQGDRTILIEPIDSALPGGGVRRLLGFRKAHHTGYFVVVVARRALHPRVADDAYDLLLPLEDFKPLDEFLMSQG